jgi:Transcriptional regulator, AbiEi antitoxin, Type IV TA system
MQALEFEREAFHRLPSILAELFDEPEPGRALISEPDHGVDAVVDAGGRRWVFQAKTSSSPGTVAVAAERLAALDVGDAVPVLIVPYMTPAGAKAAAERRLNWIDLSGNASLRDQDLYVWVQGHPNQFGARGRPASPFAPKSSRVARALLLDPSRWWRQKELAEHTDLDPGRVSRVVHRLADDRLLERDGARLRPRDPDLLLDAWADDYRFERHDIITGHLSGSGIELARNVHADLDAAQADHAFTGLPAAWALDPFARFRLVSVYVVGDPRLAADAVGLRRNERGANVQLIGPDDRGVFDGRRTINDLPCVAPVQVYLDLGHLPERAAEAAEHLRTDRSLWHADA